MYLSVISLVILGFVLLLLLAKKEKQKNDWILMSWFFLIGIQLLVFLQVEGVFPVIPALFYLNDASIFLHGPFLWLYTSSIIQPSYKQSRIKYLLHFIPFLLVLFLSYLTTPDLLFERLLTIFKILSILVYTIFSYLTLRKYQSQLKDITSNIEKVNLAWLHFLTTGILLLIFFSSIFLLFNFEGLNKINGLYLGNYLLCIFVLVVAFWGIQQAPVFINPITEEIVEVALQKKTAREDLHDPKKQHLYKKLLAHMEEQQPFLNPNLDLQDLATQLNIPAYLLSQVINSEAQQRFFDFINSQRIEYFKRKISSAKYHETTLLSLAFEAGFNSKSAFNRAFKKLEGMTPSEYVKTLSSSSA